MALQAELSLVPRLLLVQPSDIANSVFDLNALALSNVRHSARTDSSIIITIFPLREPS